MLSPATGLLNIPVASAAPLVVNAGPNQIIAFPAKDLTLFGHATNTENKPFTVQWTMMSGPAPVTFSAPEALTTTVTFTTTGTYILQLAVSDGTSSVRSTVTVTVNPASSQTAFYVDPTYTGGNNDGSAAYPWTDLGTSSTDTQWTAINNALATTPVIVYFSARQAGSDVPEETTNAVRVFRTDTSTNRLTLDGMSQYNANDVTPSWMNYTGSSKMRIRIGDGSISLGWGFSPGTSLYTQHYITLRGFEVTGRRITWKGSHTVLEYLWVHDIAFIGATVQFQHATDSSCADYGRDTDITVRNLLIERGYGEGIYISGNSLSTNDGCPSYGNTHADILVESNAIRDPGYNGAEGDGVDLKAGLTNVTVRSNVIQDTHKDGGGHARGIVSLGAFPPAKTSYLIEGNLIHGIYDGLTLETHNGTVIRNNVIYNADNMGIYAAGNPSWPNYNLAIYNNTVYGAATGVASGDSHGLILRNNLLLNNSVQTSQWNSDGFNSDYNFFAPTGGSGWNEGSHSIVQGSTSGIVMDAANGNFHLVSTSPAVDKGINLSSLANLAVGATAFRTDLTNFTRSQGVAWDIGAYGYGTAQLAPAQGLRTLGGNQ
jgi:hypothetical protein